MKYFKTSVEIFLAVTALLVVVSGCTTVDPYTGQQRIDYGATAGVAGLALGATALGIVASKDDDRRDTVIIDRRPYDRPGYRPSYRPYRQYQRLRNR